MIDEGVTRYRVEWTRSPAFTDRALEELDHWRRRLYAAKLIGHSAIHDVGYGNVSVRSGTGFYVTGTQTGRIAETGPEHYAFVADTDIANNVVRCRGPVQASSEALTHAAIYAAAPDVAAVVHAHDDALWSAAMHRIPTTRDEVRYGTPDMAREFMRLFDESAFAAGRAAVMAGHQGGLITIGTDIEAAALRMLALRREFLPRADQGASAETPSPTTDRFK